MPNKCKTLGLVPISGKIKEESLLFIKEASLATDEDQYRKLQPIKIPVPMDRYSKK